MAKRPLKWEEVNHKSIREGEAEDDSPKMLDWWNQPADQAKDTINGVVNFFTENQYPRLNQWEIASKLYANISILGYMTYNTPQQMDRGSSTSGKLSDNVIQSTIDTLTSMMSKNKPFPLFVTNDGNYKMRRKAQKLNQFMEGIFLENSVYELGKQILKDACIFGTGVCHIFTDAEGRVKFERVVPHEIWVDELEAVYGSGMNTHLGPRQMHRAKLVDRAVLRARWPDQAENIEATPSPNTFSYRIPTIANMIVVRESWHLPSSKKAKDGRHIISTDRAVLLDEPYDEDTFPFVFLRYNSRVFGFWGQGLAEQNQHIQLEINRILWTIGASYQLAGSYKILMENSSKISTSHFDNKVGTIIKYTGTPPQYITPPIIPPEMYEQWQRLRTTAFGNAGISMLSSQSQKPAGLNSGKALREAVDIESDRFQSLGQDYESFYVDIGKRAIKAVQRNHGKGGSYKVHAVGKSFDEIDWKDISLSEDQFYMQVFPVSNLPNTPEGRMQTIQEYVQAGWIPPKLGRRLMDFPDLLQVENLQNAQEDHIYRTMDRIIDVDGGDLTFESPEPFDDLQLCRTICLEYYSRYRDAELEPEKLELLRRYLAQIDYLQNAAHAQAQQAQAAMNPPQQPQANPQSPPTSDLVQNVSGIQDPTKE